MDKVQIVDFLMTYGWAILIIVIATGFLWYYGVLSPENFKPITPEERLINKCLSCLAECDGVSNVVNSSFEVIPK